MHQVNTIDSYIASQPAPVRQLLKQMRDTIHEAAPDTLENISYGIPTFTLQGKNLVHFAAAKHHIGFYPSPEAILVFQKELSVYKSAKGSVQFPLEQPLPLKLVRRMVLYRVMQERSHLHRK